MIARMIYIFDSCNENVFFFFDTLYSTCYKKAKWNKQILSMW